jgi:hypothetical protein
LKEDEKIIAESRGSQSFLILSKAISAIEKRTGIIRIPIELVNRNNDALIPASKKKKRDEVCHALIRKRSVESM